METDVTQLDTYVCVHFEESGFHIKTSWLECIDLNVIIVIFNLNLNVDIFPWLQNILTIYEQLHLFTLMKRRCGDSKNEIKTRWGDSKNEIGFDVHHVYAYGPKTGAAFLRFFLVDTKCYAIDCLGTYLTHVQTCNVTRVQSATQSTASVHTWHMSKTVM